jgi:Ca2+-transporting ATPase
MTMPPASDSRPAADQTGGEFSLDDVPGLSAADAQQRLARSGANELPSQKGRGLLAIAVEVAKEPMFLLLVAAGLLYLATGKPTDAAMLLGFVFVVMAITIIQERRTERALDALRDLSSPRALVIRDGQRTRIPGREVVPGDFLVVAEGDRVPADALLRRGSHLSIDESLLTGESVPVRKASSPSAQSMDRPGGDDLPSLYSGTLVTGGQGLCEVQSTGLQTELGRIGKALQHIGPDASPLQTETARLVRTLAIGGIGACALVVVIYGLTRGSTLQAWKDGLLAGIAMAMAILPEEFPVVLTVFLALGAWRISKSRVLTRRMPAIETLGAATVLCVDKTGTLTENRMRLNRVWAAQSVVLLADGAIEWTGPCRSALEAAVLASRADPFDPMERALHAAAAALSPRATPREHIGRLVREYPLTPGLLAMSHAWESAPGKLYIATKGAPECIAGLCKLSDTELASLTRNVSDLAELGLRVLGVADAELPAQDLPARQDLLPLRFVGLVAFEDPVRSDVPAAVAQCRTAGIRVVMITGDYPLTAASIARQAGLGTSVSVMTGPELEQLSDDDLAARIGSVQVFARVVPEQKLRIVTALKALGEIVAMTGDGVNDAPALKAAHIGIAMGGRGTDVAREASSLVLLDDDFSSIVAAIRLGRRIYDNIRKAVGFILAAHVPIAGLSMIPVFFADWPLLLLPVHIVFLELIIDPACSLVFEAESAEPDVMSRPPRPLDARLFSSATVWFALMQGAIVLTSCLIIFLVARGSHGLDSARALSFSTLVACFVVVILTSRSWHRTGLAMLREPNAAVWWVTAGSAALLALVLLVPDLRQLFRFAPLHLSDLGIGLLGATACLILLERIKLGVLGRRLFTDRPSK